jgi:hypothetical protein
MNAWFTANARGIPEITSRTTKNEAVKLRKAVKGHQE